MNQHEYANRRQAIRATLRTVEMYLLALADVGDDPCDCNLDEVRIERMPNGQFGIGAAHERYCRITINENVAAMEAGVKIERLLEQVRRGVTTSGTALDEGHPILANFHAKRNLTLLANARDLADRHGLVLVPAWDELATVLADLAEATT